MLQYSQINIYSNSCYNTTKFQLCYSHVSGFHPSKKVISSIISF